MSGMDGGAAAAGIQAAAMIAVAEMQRQTEKDKLELQRDIWETQKKWAQMYHDLWFDKYRPVEISFLDYISNKELYKPQYDAAESRAVVSVRREFAHARARLRKCIDPRCIGEFCYTNKMLAIEEAKAAVAAANRGFRAEEARKDLKDQQWEQTIIQVLQLGRGLSASAQNLLSGASQAAANAAGINPNSGYAAAIGGIANLVSNRLVERQYNNNQHGGGSSGGNWGGVNSDASPYRFQFGTQGSGGFENSPPIRT